MKYDQIPTYPVVSGAQFHQREQWLASWPWLTAENPKHCETSALGTGDVWGSHLGLEASLVGPKGRGIVSCLRPWRRRRDCRGEA